MVVDEREQPGEERPGARRRDEPADQPHRERAAEALAADLVQLGLPRGGQVELERAEHRRGHRDEQRDEREHDDRVREQRAEPAVPPSIANVTPSTA